MDVVAVLHVGDAIAMMAAKALTAAPKEIKFVAAERDVTATYVVTAKNVHVDSSDVYRLAAVRVAKTAGIAATFVITVPLVRIAIVTLAIASAMSAEHFRAATLTA